MKRLLLLTALLAFNVSAVEKDKQLHFGVSTLIGGGAQAYYDSPIQSGLACMGVGVAKEVLDEVDYGGFDTKDLIADALGCAVGISGVKLIQVYSDDDAIGVGLEVEF